MNEERGIKKISLYAAPGYIARDRELRGNSSKLSIKYLLQILTK